MRMAHVSFSSSSFAATFFFLSSLLPNHQRDSHVPLSLRNRVGKRLDKIARAGELASAPVFGRALGARFATR